MCRCSNLEENLMHFGSQQRKTSCSTGAGNLKHILKYTLAFKMRNTSNYRGELLNCLDMSSLSGNYPKELFKLFNCSKVPVKRYL